MKEFWEKYMKADEIKQSKLLDELTLFKDIDKSGFVKFSTKSLIKSYFDDIIKFMKDKNNISPSNQESERDIRK